ncbi:hypothetical protein FI667_g15328, partial [Globisporangium splendens]
MALTSFASSLSRDGDAGAPTWRVCCAPPCFVSSRRSGDATERGCGRVRGPRRRASASANPLHETAADHADPARGERRDAHRPLPRAVDAERDDDELHDDRFNFNHHERDDRPTREEGREEEGEGDDDPSLVVGLSRAQVEAAERYRWASFFVILMYVVTFFAWPSYFMSAFGLATGIVGYVSYRLTQERVPHHMISVVMFVACNYAMMVFLVWVFVSFFVVTLQQKSTGQPALVLLIVFMSIGLFLHFRVQRVARDFMNAFKPGVTRTEPPRPRRPIAITIARPPRQPFVADDASSYLPTTNVAQAAPS